MKTLFTPSTGPIANFKYTFAFLIITGFIIEILYHNWLTPSVTINVLTLGGLTIIAIICLYNLIENYPWYPLLGVIAPYYGYEIINIENHKFNNDASNIIKNHSYYDYAIVNLNTNEIIDKYSNYQKALVGLVNFIKNYKDL